MSKIYVVKSNSGEYEDYSEWIEKAFVDKQDALNYALELDKEHFDKPKDVSDELYNNYLDTLDNLPDWGQASSRDIVDYQKWYKEMEKKDRDYIIAEMAKKGFKVTNEMINALEAWETNSFQDWGKCTVEEVELCS